MGRFRRGERAEVVCHVEAEVIGPTCPRLNDSCDIPNIEPGRRAGIAVRIGLRKPTVVVEIVSESKRRAV